MYFIDAFSLFYDMHMHSGRRGYVSYSYIRKRRVRRRDEKRSRSVERAIDRKSMVKAARKRVGLKRTFSCDTRLYGVRRQGAPVYGHDGHELRMRADA